MSSTAVPRGLTLVGFRCANCDLTFYIPRPDAGDRIKHGLLCPRCGDGEHVHYLEWIELGHIVRVVGSDTERRCAEPLAS